jgi:glycosyltransferase involved in cell wall biosynthesis
MKLLYVTNVLPYPPYDGGRIRRYHLLRALAAEHEVCLLSAAPNDEELSEFQRLNPRLRFERIPYRPEHGRVRAAEAARSLLSREAFDAVHVAELWQWPGARALGTVPTVLDAENVSTLLQRRVLALRGVSAGSVEERAVETLERQAFARADRILACSEFDAARIREMSPGAAVRVVPNGVDLERYGFHPRAKSEASPLVTFIGMLSYAPNVDAARYLVHEIAPLLRSLIPEARIRIVGRYPAAEVMALAERPGVEVIPDVPDSLPYFQEADVLAVPLRAGSGTRLKILEALAVGCPVVTTSIGCEGLDVTSGQHLLIADTPADFAARIAEILTQRDAAATMTLQGRRLVETRYDWRQIGNTLREVYRDLATDPKAVP